MKNPIAASGFARELGRDMPTPGQMLLQVQQRQDQQAQAAAKLQEQRREAALDWFDKFEVTDIDQLSPQSAEKLSQYRRQIMEQAVQTQQAALNSDWGGYEQGRMMTSRLKSDFETTVQQTTSAEAPIKEAVKKIRQEGSNGIYETDVIYALEDIYSSMWDENRLKPGLDITGAINQVMSNSDYMKKPTLFKSMVDKLGTISTARRYNDGSTEVIESEEGSILARRNPRSGELIPNADATLSMVLQDAGMADWINKTAWAMSDQQQRENGTWVNNRLDAWGKIIRDNSAMLSYEQDLKTRNLPGSDLTATERERILNDQRYREISTEFAGSFGEAGLSMPSKQARQAVKALETSKIKIGDLPIRTVEVFNPMQQTAADAFTRDVRSLENRLKAADQQDMLVKLGKMGNKGFYVIETKGPTADGEFEQGKIYILDPTDPADVAWFDQAIRQADPIAGYLDEITLNAPPANGSPYVFGQ